VNYSHYAPSNDLQPTLGRYMQGDYESDISQDSQNSSCIDPGSQTCMDVRRQPNAPLSRTSWIDAAYTDESLSPKVRNGVKMGEGDGTVSLLSLGAMCVEGWKRKRWNPAGIKVTTVEVRFDCIPKKKRRFTLDASYPIDQ